MHARPTHTFLFADLVGFTALTETHGDEAAAELATSFSRTVTRLAGDHVAETVKSIGDAVMVRCDDAREAVRLGLRILDELDLRSGFPGVRVGMNTGSAVERDGDWFGAAVNLAARVSSLARGGEVLVSETTRAAIGDLLGVALEDLGPQTFKNIHMPQVVYAASHALTAVEESPQRRRITGAPAPTPAVARAYA